MSAVFFFSSRRRHTRWPRDWSSDVCSSDLWIVQGLTLFACGALADRAFRRTGSAPRSRVLPAGALLILGAVFLRSEERRVGKEGNDPGLPDRRTAEVVRAESCSQCWSGLLR